MPALDRDGNFVPGTFDEEADRAWANVIAAAAGYSPDDLLYVQVLLGDIGNYPISTTGGDGSSPTWPGPRPG
jgi:2-iminobutanoate/2-iminopropanoate deaminase